MRLFVCTASILYICIRKKSQTNYAKAELNSHEFAIKSAQAYSTFQCQPEAWVTALICSSHYRKEIHNAESIGSRGFSVRHIDRSSACLAQAHDPAEQTDGNR